VEFEKAFNTYTNAPVLAFDPTMKDINVFKNKILKGRLLDAVKQLRWLFKWLRQEKNLAKYQINFIQEGISDKDIPSYKTFKTHIEEYQLTNKKLLLKIDVDGAKFLVFKNLEIYNQLDNVIQLIIEFHDLDLKIKEVHDIIKKLSATHTLIHIHGNNYGDPFEYNQKIIPKVIEATFIHNSFLSEKILSNSDYPIKNLDSPCDKSKADIKLDFFK